MIRKSVADSARYDVFDLAEAALQGQITRAHRVLLGLRGEGIADAVVLWALARDIRLLCRIKHLTDSGEGLESAFARQKERFWDERKVQFVQCRAKVDPLTRRTGPCCCAPRPTG